MNTKRKAPAAKRPKLAATDAVAKESKRLVARLNTTGGAYALACSDTRRHIAKHYSGELKPAPVMAFLTGKPEVKIKATDETLYHRIRYIITQLDASGEKIVKGGTVRTTQRKPRNGGKAGGKDGGKDKDKDTAAMPKLRPNELVAWVLATYSLTEIRAIKEAL